MGIPWWMIAWWRLLWRRRGDLVVGDAELMRNEFTAVVERDGEWHVAYYAEAPGANGQGRTRTDCLDNLWEAITRILEHRREDSLRAIPPDAEQDVVVLV